MLRNPVPRETLARAQPNGLMALHVIEQPAQGADAAGTADDPAVQTDGHHAGAAFAAQSIQPIESIAAINKKLHSGGEVAAALQAAVIVVEAVGHHQMRAAADAGPVREVVVVGV